MSRSDGTRLVLTPEPIGLREQSLPLERAKSSRGPPKAPPELFNKQDGYALALIPGEHARPGRAPTDNRMASCDAEDIE